MFLTRKPCQKHIRTTSKRPHEPLAGEEAGTMTLEERIQVYLEEKARQGR